MFPIAPELAFLGLFVQAVLGLFAGLFTGFVVSVILKVPKQGLVKDALLGFMGFTTTFIVCIIVPLPQNFEPFIAAIIVAVALPALHQFFRFKEYVTHCEE